MLLDRIDLPLVAALGVLLVTSPCLGLETVRLASPAEGSGVMVLEGRIVAEDSIGTLALQEADGALHLLQADEIADRRSDERPFEPLTADAFGERLLEGLPASFAVYKTPRYVVAYRTSRDFAKWTASTLERLHRAFVACWKKRGMDLHPPEFPLGVIIHATQQEFQAATQAELGTPLGNAVGYYSLATNRVRTFDLSGHEANRGVRRRSSLREINQMLASPASRPLVSTVVHEATHQVAFNVGVHVRHSDLPLWLVEGMATYFEAPDLTSSRGWRGIGKVNYSRLKKFRTNLPRWGSGGLASLTSSDTRLRDPRTAVDGYADAWALTYYLIRYRGDEYTAYVKMQAEKAPYQQGSPGHRMEEFARHFGDPAELQADFLQRMSRLR